MVEEDRIVLLSNPPPLPSHKDLPLDIDKIGPEVIIADLDGFLWFNDRLGFDTGTKIILQVSSALREVASSTGSTVYRVGGDEFLFSGVSGDGLERLAIAIRDAVRHVNVSIFKPNENRPTFLKINSVMLRMTPDLREKAFGVYGVTSEFRQWMGKVLHARRQESNPGFGLTVDCRGSGVGPYDSSLI